jgi:hypothetical protein
MYDGIHPNPSNPRHPQLTQLRQIAGDRKVDALVVSIGINDIHFADVITDCIVADCSIPGNHSALLNNRLNDLPLHYSSLTVALTNMHIGSENVFLLEYPDATKDDDGAYCSAEFTVGGITQTEWQWAFENMMMPLNARGAEAANLHGWHRIGGLSDAFTNHGICADDTWSTDFVDSYIRQGEVKGAFHPNVIGHGVYAAYIYSALRSHLIDGPGGGTGGLPTSVRFLTSRGDVEIDVSNDGLSVGDRITIAPGSSHQETRTIVGKGSLILDEPLDFAHEPWEPIVRAADVPELTPTNRRPLLADDAVEARCGDRLELDALANDSDLDGEALSIVAASAPLEIVDGIGGEPDTLRVVISGGFSGGSLSYEVADASGARSTASVAVTVTPPFSDVANNHPFCVDIAWMKSSGVSTGFTDGTYRPSAVVTRQAMSAFMARLAGASLAPCTSAPFADVPIDHPFCREIAWMKATGVSTGFSDNTYRPSANVTRQAMSAFMRRVSALLD